MSIFATVLQTRQTLKLRPKSEIISEISDALDRLVQKTSRDDIENFAVAMGRVAVVQLLNAKTEDQIIALACRWVRVSLRESVDPRREIVSRLGAAILSAAPGGTS